MTLDRIAAKTFGKRGFFAAATAAATVCLVSIFAPAPVRAAQMKEVSPVTDRILLVVVDDLKSVRHESPGGGGKDGRVEVEPLDTARAAVPEAYAVASKDDPAYSAPQRPVTVGRKAKGHNFVNNNYKYEWATTHYVYLALPRPMQPGRTYTVTAGDIPGLSGAKTLTLTFDPRKARSETVHVNQIGYVPAAPVKVAYLSHWMGDRGPLALDEYADTSFHLINVKTGKAAFTGRPTLRKRYTETDSGQPNDGPGNSFTAADVWQCDFSAFKTPGEYVVSVDRIGCSFPFRIGADIYREAFIISARALYHQRCGIELKAPYTKWTRKACHRPETRVFMQTDHRQMDSRFSDGPKGKPFKTTGERRMDVWGGWHDAADWDREDWHLPTAQTLLLAYECAPQNFTDGELNIPESGNGIPDLLDEARWCIDFYRRIQRPDGGVSVGTFASSHPKGGENSVTDTLEWYVYAEDPAASYRYASAAAHLAHCLTVAGKAKEAGPYIESAKKAWEWAGKNLRDGDEAKVRDLRFNAAAALFRATGEKSFEDSLKRDTTIETPTTLLREWGKREQDRGAWIYSLTERPGMDAAFKERIRQAVLFYARNQYVETSAKRGMRQGYNWWIPMWWGAATTPNANALMVAHRLTTDPAFLAVHYANADFVLGGNPLNMVWTTGLGKRSPREVMHIDSWYDGIEPVVPGITILGPYRYTEEDSKGAWSPAFVQKTAYPDAKLWPPLELWFDSRLTPPTNEFTVGSIAESAAAFGYLRGPKQAIRAVE